MEKKRKCTNQEIIQNQGFPLSYKFSEGKIQRTRELGESVPPKSAKMLAKILKKTLNRSD